MLVVFVRIAFRSNGADLPPGNALFSTFFEAREIFHEGMAGTEVDLPVRDEDVVVLKRRASAFAGTDLDLVLRAHAVDTIAVAGVATSAMVAATCVLGTQFILVRGDTQVAAETRPQPSYLNT